MTTHESEIGMPITPAESSVVEAIRRLQPDGPVTLRELTDESNLDPADVETAMGSLERATPTLAVRERGTGDEIT